MPPIEKKNGCVGGSMTGRELKSELTQRDRADMLFRVREGENGSRSGKKNGKEEL